MSMAMSHEAPLQEAIHKYGKDEWRDRDAAFRSYLAHIFCDDLQDSIFFLSDCTDYEFCVLCGALYEILVIAECRGEDLKEIMSEVYFRASEVEDDQLYPYVARSIKRVQAWRPSLGPESC